jgi:chromosome segregation ATPase
MKVIVVCALLSVVTASRRSSAQAGVWTPNDLDMVSKALDAILANPRMSKEQRTTAETVATLVRTNLKAVESGKLKGAARAAKVGEALTALTGLEHEFAKRAEDAKAKEDAADAHMAALKKEMEAKKALLAKEEDQMKVLTMEKELMEKKLKLDTLMEKKQAMEEHKAKEKDETERKEILQTLAAVSKNMTNADAQTAALSHLKQRVDSIKAAITKIDADEKADQKKLASIKSDAKVAKMLQSVKKKNHREHAKAKALKNAELAHLEKAIQSIQHGDAAGVRDVVKQIESDAKRLDAKSGDFLH